MTPLQFGPPARRLFGLYHAPEAVRNGGTGSQRAVLICPPFGQEAIRSQRLFRVLADRLARSGVAVLRFDYFGTGDSLGDDAEGEFDGWQRDIRAAHEELRRRADSLGAGRRIVWIGARLGASLAVLAAQGGRCDPDKLVLWDPVVVGADYLQHLRERHVDALERSFCIPDRDWRRALARDADAFTGEALGFALSPTLLAQLRRLDAQGLRLTALHRTLVLADPQDNAARLWCEAESARATPLQWTPFKHTMQWTSDPHPNNAMVPAEALQRLIRAIDE